MEFPQEINDICSAVALQYSDDIDAAVDAAVKQVQQLESYEDMVESLVRDSIRGKIHDFRHMRNVMIKREARLYGQPAKVDRGNSTALSAAVQSAYNLSVGGRLLGFIKGSELSSIAETEFALANGHTFNGRLCQRLAAIVPGEKTVKEAVSERRLKKLLQELSDKPANTAA